MSRWRGVLKAILTLFFAVSLAASQLSFSQQPPVLSAHAAEIRQRVEQLVPGNKISVIPLQGQEAFGSFVSKGQQEFTFHDVDTGADAMLKYEEVKVIRNGYGGYNHLRHRHTDKKRALIVGAVVVAGLLGLVFAIALSS
jgi:hypothetical protein